MAETDLPQLYLITPPEFDLSEFPARLDAVLQAAEIACLRLALATRDEDKLLRAADAVREIAHAHDVALVIDTHVVSVGLATNSLRRRTRLLCLRFRTVRRRVGFTFIPNRHGRAHDCIASIGRA